MVPIDEDYVEINACQEKTALTGYASPCREPPAIRKA
jgi:hypothetical protein